MPILTRAILHRGLSDKKMLRPVQFRALGFSGPFKGWKQKLVGCEFSQEALDEFVRLRRSSGYRKQRHKSRLKKAKGEWKNSQQKRVEAPQKQRRPEVKLTEDPYKNKRWLELAERIKRRDGHRCVLCGNDGGESDKNLAVHHLLYENGKEVWDVPDCYLITVCHSCHKKEHSRRLSPPKKHFK